MKFFLNLSFFILGIGNMMPAQSQIRTVQCYPVGSPFAEPVIELGSGQQLFFSFDDLSSETNSYTYKIVHCDPDWNNSNLSSFTYLTGFFSNPLDNYEYSFNTVVPYTRFTLNLPDAKMLVICMSVSWVVLEWYLSHDFIVGNRSLSSCKSVYYVLYKCCFLLFSQVTYQCTFVIWLIVR